MSLTIFSGLTSEEIAETKTGGVLSLILLKTNNLQDIIREERFLQIQKIQINGVTQIILGKKDLMGGLIQKLKTSL